MNNQVKDNCSGQDQHPAIDFFKPVVENMINGKGTSTASKVKPFFKALLCLSKENLLNS